MDSTGSALFSLFSGPPLNHLPPHLPHQLFTSDTSVNNGLDIYWLSVWYWFSATSRGTSLQVKREDNYYPISISNNHLVLRVSFKDRWCAWFVWNAKLLEYNGICISQQQTPVYENQSRYCVKCNTLTYSQRNISRFLCR